MTNEEKAKYEARAYRRRLEYDTTLCNDDLNAASIEVYNRCLKMAEWKDQQFKEYLEKTKEWLKEKIYNDNYWGYDNEGPFLMQTNFSPISKPI